MKKNILLYFYFLLFGNISFSQGEKLSIKEIDSLLEVGNAYFRNADFENSFKVLQKTLYHSELAKNDSISAYACNRIARNFCQILEFDKAKFFYFQALKFAENASRKDIYIDVLINLGNFYGVKENYNFKKSTDYYFRSLDIANKTNDFYAQYTINFNLAWTYFDEDKFDVGYKYLDIINKNFKKYGSDDYLVTLNMLNGMYYSHLNQNSKASYYFLKGINKNNTIILKEDKQFLYNAYSKFLAKIGDFKGAYQNKLMGEKIIDSLFDKMKLSKASIAGVNLEIDNYKNRLEQLEIENNKQRKIFIKSRVINILSFLLVLILILLLYSLRKSANNNKITNENLVKKNEQLKIAINKANEANKVKSQFVSTISHELRTPLYGVIGITDIIYNEHKQLIDNKHLDALKFSANYLLSLINDILQISKIEESEIILDNQDFNIFNEIQSITNSLQFIATKNNVIIETKIDKKIPHQIFGDQIRLSQILMNLLTNALKFTKNGKVIIELQLENIVEKINFIHFKIQDSGIGIAPENQEKVFDKFTQIKQKNDDYQGTGLGLSIVKRLIDVFKSEIYLESEVNKGSTFTFTIGFGNAKNLEIESTTVVENLEIKILVVEDNKINQLVTKKIIQQNKQACKIVSSGQEAIDILKIEYFDVILMDINMPDLNGFETSIEIRKMAINVPIIALTAYNRKQVLEQAILSGIDAVLVKPFQPPRLFEIIRELLNKKNVG